MTRRFYLTGEVPGEPFPPEIHGEKICGLVWCCTGSEERADGALREERTVAEPLFEHVDPMPYPAIQSVFDDIYPPGDQWYWKGDFVAELSDDAVAVHERFAEVLTTQSFMYLYPIDGAASRVDADETAWNYRDATWSMVIAGVDSDADNDDLITDWAREYWEAFHPHSAGGSYVNFMMDEGGDRIRATCGDNHDRLRRSRPSTIRTTSST